MYYIFSLRAKNKDGFLEEKMVQTKQVFDMETAKKIYRKYSIALIEWINQSIINLGKCVLIEIGNTNHMSRVLMETDGRELPKPKMI